MVEALSAHGNPSSVHHEGRAARQQLEDARRRIASYLNIAPARLVFVSSATEANNLVLRQSTMPPLVSAIEHPSVLVAANSRTIRVSESGVIDITALEEALDQATTDIVSIMWANNEIGTQQPIADAAALIRARGGRLHVDAVQALGRLPIDASLADFLTLSAHKIGGPKGCGALIVPEGQEVDPLLRGGGQERWRRAGTENTAGAVGFAAALDDMPDDEGRRINALREQFENALSHRLPLATVIARNAPRVPHISAISLPGCRAETLVMRLDLDGVAVSAGAACSSGKVGPSHVLAAMGYSAEHAASSIRVSFGWSSTVDDIDRAVESLIEACPALT